jgi:hypothetical protein
MSRLRPLMVPIAVLFGAVVFVGLRVPLLVEAYRFDAVGDVGGAGPWLARSIPIVGLAYAAAAIPAAVLVRDGARAWWVPSVVFLALGTPIERWLGYDSLVVRSAGSFAGMAVDLALVLAPALILRAISDVERRAIGRDRLLAAAVVLAAYLAWVLPRSMDGPDPASGSVALVFLFAVCWRTDSLWRVITLVAVALASSKLVAYTIFEGVDAVAAGLDVSLDVLVITAGGLLLGPIASAIERATARTRLART